MLTDVQDFFGQRGPLEDIVERRDFRKVGGDLNETTHCAQPKSAPLVECDGRTFVRNHRLWSVDDGLEHALKI